MPAEKWSTFTYTVETIDENSEFGINEETTPGSVNKPIKRTSRRGTFKGQMKFNLRMSKERKESLRKSLEF